MSWTYHPIRNEVIVTYGLDGDAPAKSVSGGKWVIMDLDSKGELIRLCIRMASRLCPVEVLQSLDQAPEAGESLCSIPEAARKLGVKSYVMRREVLDGGMPAVKSADSWRVRECLLDLCREIFEARRHLGIEQQAD
jgi:hypothetical protein